MAIFTVVVVEGRTGRKFGSLGGYLWDSGPVRSIAARWRVPKVLGGSDAAQASTWVGIQQAIRTGAPFVQVGTIEAPFDDYEAFWSDTAHRFKPQHLGFVSPGDMVLARIVSTPSGWRLTLDDISTQTVETASSADGRGRSFGLGEWFEEDPTDVFLHAPEPYPKLSTVTFQQLRLNGRPPPYRPLYSQWLALPGERYFAPTPLAHDQFSMRPADVSRAGGEYLTDVAPFDAAYHTFLAQSERWTLRTTAAQAAAQAAVFASAAHATDRLLAAQHWQPDVQSEVSRELNRNRSVVTDLNMIATLAPAQRAAWHQHLLRDLHKGAEIGHLIRRALRIPEYIPRS